MAKISGFIREDDGNEYPYNATADQNCDGPVWGIATKVTVPKEVSAKGAKAVLEHLMESLSAHGPDVSHDVTVLESETEDPNYAPDWIYEEFETDDLIALFRKRGGDPHVILTDDNFGDDTRAAFKDIALPGEELITGESDDSMCVGMWKVRRTPAGA